MKQNILKIILAFLAVLLCITFSKVLMFYSEPMEDLSLNLSLQSEDGFEEITAETYDDKGWSVYTQESDIKKELEPNYYGSYFGLEAGQTFYYSRLLKEELDSPTLKISPVNRMFSVWLDEQLLYTDCPELDNRIGYLTLPMNEWDRNEDITISLPLDYQGKTLTIAQSTPMYSEASSIAAYPADVMLYCGFSYESALIAESFTIAIFASACFVIGILLFILMIYRADFSLLFLSIIPFLWMSSLISNTSYFLTYFGTYDNSLLTMIPLLSAGALLIHFAFHAGKYGKIFYCIVGVFLLTLINCIIVILRFNWFSPTDNITNLLPLSLPEWFAFIGLISTLLFAVLFWRKNNSYYQTFRILAPILILLYWILSIFLDSHVVLEQITLTLKSRSITYIFIRFLYPMIIAGILNAVLDAFKNEISLRAEKQMLDERRELTLQSYENLRRQHEEIMLIRHDMMKHFHVLNDMSNDPKTKAYLEDLIGQNQKVRPVVQTGNKMLDVILNSKLSSAIDSGIAVEITRAAAPGKLPISDADLCSLMMNIMDNALTGAHCSGSDRPMIRLDIHEKNKFLAITCENSADMTKGRKKSKKETVQKHGLGLKIIHQITKRYHGMIDTSYDSSLYKVKVAIPLS